MLVPVTKSGRAATERNADHGSIIHIMETPYKPKGDFDNIWNGWDMALCGAKPGRRRGNGWKNYGFNLSIASCPKCKKKLAAIAPNSQTL